MAFRWAQGNPKSALENLVEAQAMFKEIGGDVGLANCFLNIGMVYADIDEFPKARELYEKAIEKITDNIQIQTALFPHSLIWYRN